MEKTELEEYPKVVNGIIILTDREARIAEIAEQWERNKTLDDVLQHFEKITNWSFPTFHINHIREELKKLKTRTRKTSQKRLSLTPNQRQTIILCEIFFHYFFDIPFLHFFNFFDVTKKILCSG